MNFKRILSLFIILGMLCTNALAFTPYLPEKQPEESAGQSDNSDSKNEQEKTPYENKNDLSEVYRPNDYEYRLFMDILDEYVNSHLYDFTKEEVISKFFSDFLTENPMYVKLFINYLLGTMDPYSSYHQASSKFLEPDDEAAGFGFLIKDSDKGVYIENTLYGTNAWEAGFLSGDRFVSIAGINVENQTFDVVSAILARPYNFIPVSESLQEPVQQEQNAQAQAKADNNVPIEIVVDRDGTLKSFLIEKGSMPVSQIESMITENDGKRTGYIKLASFLGDTTDKEFSELVQGYAKDGIRHLTIDLRNNGGGSLDYALSMAENFIAKDELICYYVDNSTPEPVPVYSTTDKISFDSISILINEKTASAAELFTSILSDKGIAKTVGAKSYGKSLGQSVFTLGNGDYITITTYQMLSEKLESYDGIGLMPDIAIEDVEMYYELPSLGIFNHQNAKQIQPGVYSDVTKALEDRMVIMGILRDEFCDGIFDDVTSNALYVFQTDHGIEATGTVTFETVSKITRVINSYKNTTYYDDSQFDVAMKIHHSFSQGKRLAAEKETLRKKQTALIEERDAKLEAELEALEAQKAADSVD